MNEQDEPAKQPPAKAPPRRLGRGLGALLGEARREEPLVTQGKAGGRPGEPAANRAGSPVAAGASGLASIPVSAIEPHPNQPRRHFDEAALDELAASISARGVIQPVIVRPLDGGYQLVAGERRWRAAQKAQLHEIPALIRELAERDVMAIALIENVQREDLNPIEEARAYQRLSQVEKLTQAEIARLVEKSRSHIANLQRLLALPEKVIAHLEAGRLSMGHARALIGHERAVELADEAVARGLSVREIEKLARKPAKSETAKAPGPRMAGRTGDDADIAAVQNHLEEFLGLPVRINTDTDPRSGAVTIRYRTLDQLDLICQRLTGGGI